MVRVKLILGLSVLFIGNFVSAQSKNIVEAAGDLGLNTLLSLAGQFPDIVTALSETQGITVFAPTDRAFAKLPAATLNALQNDPAALKSVLLYHVSPESILTSQLPNGASKFPTLGGGQVQLDKSPMMRMSRPMVTVNGIRLCRSDLRASNGIVHTIDSVIIPPTENMLDLVVGDPELSTLTTAVTEAGLASAFQGEGPLTLFAPTNAAFEKLPQGTLQTLLQNPDQLANILKGHVASGALYKSGLKGKSVQTLAGNMVMTYNKSPHHSTYVYVDRTNPAKIVAPDTTATNGVVHKIDTVLVP